MTVTSRNRCSLKKQSRYASKGIEGHRMAEGVEEREH